MNDEIIRLLKDTANNFAALADAFETYHANEQKRINTRMDFIERTACDTKDALKAAAELILRM